MSRFNHGEETDECEGHRTQDRIVRDRTHGPACVARRCHKSFDSISTAIRHDNPVKVRLPRSHHRLEFHSGYCVRGFSGAHLDPGCWSRPKGNT